MEINLSGKTVLITGGASGAGETIVREFAKTGCDIAFTYNSSRPDELLNDLSDINIKAYQYNQADLNSVNKLVDDVLSDFGHIDVLINNAGIYPAKDIRDISEEDYDKMMDTNTKGVFFLSRKVAESMNNGSIINISSINASNPASKLIHYGMSKAAVEMETKCLASEYGPNVRVNCIAPGLIYRDGIEKQIPSWVESYNQRAALKRLVRPEEIADTCIFLASDLSSGITGQIITVDCGVSLAPYFNNEL